MLHRTVVRSGGNVSTMKILIKISEEMDKNSYKAIGSLEDRYIRMPLELREICSLSPGEFLNLRNKAGEIITLKVNIAYGSDAEKDPLVAFVTSQVFEALDLRNSSAYEQEVEVVEGITLGCDPEFFLVNRANNLIVHAGKFFQKFGEIGHDGLMMELRPLPSTDENVVTANIRNLLLKTRAAINQRYGEPGNIMFFGASHYQGVYAGFHLHFGLPLVVLQNPNARTGMLKQIVRALDYYVGIPSIIAEGEEDYRRRTATSTDYGKPGVHRIDNLTLEYRVPSGSMLRHPLLTKGLIGLGATVTEDIVSRVRMCTEAFTNISKVSTFEHLKGIYPNIPDVKELFRSICSRDLGPATSHLPTIREGITQMVGFGRRKNSIAEYFNCVNEGAKFGYDIEKNWRSYYEGQQASLDVLSASF